MWSVAHGLTMLIIDHLTRAELSIDDLIETVLRAVAHGLTARNARQLWRPKGQLPGPPSLACCCRREWRQTLRSQRPGD
jgi:hypothetical protein